MKIHEPSSIKRQQRQHLRQQVRSLGQDRRERASEVIVDRLEEALGEFSSGAVLLYAALPTEANLWGLVSRCPRFQFALPRVISEKGAAPEMECWVFGDRDRDLAPGAYGIEEPLPDRCEAIGVDALDVVIVPALGYTVAGARLGKGGGYYDWLLGQPSCRARTLGVCFACQLMDELPIEAHDQGVDQVITEA